MEYISERNVIDIFFSDNIFGNEHWINFKMVYVLYINPIYLERKKQIEL